jgi:2-oxoglutarate dehydrogenase E1 component
MTPKSLLRHPMAISDTSDFTEGSTFHRVLWDDAEKGHSKLKLKADDKIKRVVMCSGKVYYDLLAERDARGQDDTYLMRLEQIYPTPTVSLKAELGRFKGADMIWCQEEPKNQGAWAHIEPELETILTEIGAKQTRFRYAGRKASASPATGLASRHKFEQETLVKEALG